MSSLQKSLGGISLYDYVQAHREPYQNGWRRSIGLEARFKAKHLKLPNGCWRWTGSNIKGRYGSIVINHCMVYAHRLAYTLFRGPIPEGHDVCHTCDFGMCVNPDHLFTGTASDNMRDAAAKLRTTIGERNARSKLSSDEIINIRALSSQGTKRSEIAARFGVTRSNVSYIVSGKTWRHI